LRDHKYQRYQTDIEQEVATDLKNLVKILIEKGGVFVHLKDPSQSYK